MTLGITWSSLEPLLHILIIDLLLRIVLVAWILVRKSRSPQTALTWIVLVMGLPILGLVLYMLVGETRLGTWRRKRHARALATVDKPEIRASADPTTHVNLPYVEKQISTLAEQVSDSPTVGGNLLQLIGDSEEFIDTLIADIDSAQRHAHLLFFIYLPDNSGRKVADALMRAAKRGIACRLLVDAVGSKTFLKDPICKELKSSGVHVASCLPVNAIRMMVSRIDLRNHRKIMVIDGQVGYTGSNNLADAAFAPKPKYAPWVDCTVRIDGPAVKELQVLFLEDWFMETDEFVEPELQFRPQFRPDGIPVQIIATGPNFYNEATTQLVQGCMQLVRRELILTTPYFVPDQATITNLQVAARRGVEVSLVLPKNNDSKLVAAASRSTFQCLLEAGVMIQEFDKGLLHAKTITIDKDIAIIMSANLDRRSYDLNFECGAIIYDSDFASQLRFLQQQYIDQSIPLDGAAWARRPLMARIHETAAGLLGPLL